VSVGVDERVDRIERWRGTVEARLVRIETASIATRDTLERMAATMEKQAEALAQAATTRAVRAQLGRWARWILNAAIALAAFAGGRFT